MEVHFLSEIISVQDGAETRDLEIAEFVRPGRMLVTVAAQGAAPKKGPANSEVRVQTAGHCEFSEDGSFIRATVAGYPHIDSRLEKEVWTASISVTPLLRVSEDGMKVYLTLHPPLGEEPALQLEDLQTLLAQAGVVYGIDSRALAKALAKVAELRQPVVDLPVARGMHPVDGQDAYLRMEIEIGALPGKIRGDGSVDFRERRMFVSVEEGQLIATRVRETPGVPGKTVFGQAIPQKIGRGLTVRVTEDALYNEKFGTVRATKAGVVSLVKDSVIKVSSKQTISGNVDFSTGNIYSKNAIEISGSVASDFVVAVRGDVLIGGDVQSASISSHGNLVVKGGIIGAGSNIKVRGDADINFIENGLLHADGNVAIRKSSYYSTIIAGGNITGDQKTKILGGVLVCGGSLITGDIGSGSGGPTDVSVGTDVKRYQRYQELHQKVIELEGQTARWLQRHGAEAEKSAVMLDWERELVKVQTELSHLNLIPGSPVDSASEDFMIDDDAEIVIFGRIFAGTRLRIGNSTTTIAINQKARKYLLDKNKQEIIDQPLEKDDPLERE
jgi:uncharacterized protein (DUF342 family)